MRCIHALMLLPWTVCLFVFFFCSTLLFPSVVFVPIRCCHRRPNEPGGNWSTALCDWVIHVQIHPPSQRTPLVPYALCLERFEVSNWRAFFADWDRASGKPVPLYRSITSWARRRKYRTRTLLVISVELRTIVLIVLRAKQSHCIDLLQF